MLPDLPKHHKMHEADFGVLFRKWWSAQKSPLQGEIELKDAGKTDSLPFSAFSPDQEAIARLATSARGVLVRRAQGTTGAADYSGLVNTPYWLAVRYKGHFEVISVGTFLLEKSRSICKSLTGARARELSVISVRL